MPVDGGDQLRLESRDSSWPSRSGSGFHPKAIFNSKDASHECVLVIKTLQLKLHVLNLSINHILFLLLHDCKSNGVTEQSGGKG